MGFQVIGDIAVLKRPDKRLAKEILGKYKTVCVIGKVSGKERKPSVKRLAGNGFETTHKENGIFYKLDVSKVMFSKGNVFERQRIVKQVKEGEVVVDMFAGIGYFSLPIAKARPTARIFCIEINPDSVHYLRENVLLNRVNNVAVIQGDSRKVLLPEKADRVLMGYFPGTEKFLASAFSMLKDKGWVHYHNVYFDKDIPEKVLQEVKTRAAGAGFEVKETGWRKVKSFAPHRYHVVADVFLKAKK